MVSKDYDISASRIKTFAKCPEQYRLKYVEEKEPTKRRKGYGELGSIVHEAIENVLTEHPTERNERALTSRFKQEFFALEDSGEYDMTLIDDQQRGDGLSCLETAASWLAKPEQDVEIRGIEQPCHFTIDAVDRTAIGYMDVATENGIWDWKTGRIRDDTSRDEIIQGSVYMAGYHNEFGELPEHIKFVYLKEETVRTVNPTQDSWKEMLKHARNLVNGERKDEYPADPENGPCYFCGFEMWCSASEVSPGQIQEEIDSGNTDLWGSI